MNRSGDDPVLDAQIARAAAFSAEYPVVLANHLPMLLVALHALGAGPARRDDFADHYASTNRLLPPPPDHHRIDAGNWHAYLGMRQLEGDYRGFFTGEVARVGADAAIAHYLPDLLPGIAASALHALMRLAYARLRRDPAEVAVALGYWAAAWMTLGDGTGAAPDTDDPAEVFRRMAAEPSYATVRPPTDLLWHSMRAVGALPAFAPVLDWLRTGPDIVARLAATSLTLFAGTMQFAALHAVTGTHWVRLLGGHGGPALSRRFWQAIAATFANMGCPSLPDPALVADWRTLPAPAWPELHAAACRSQDEHDISLTFSAWQEDMLYNDPLYRVAAARQLRLLP